MAYSLIPFIFVINKLPEIPPEALLCYISHFHRNKQEVKMSVSQFIRSDIQAMTAYPVANIPQDFIKLDAMEVPYTFPENLQQELMQALAQAPINRYPNPVVSGLPQALSDAFSIPENAQIALGNGSDELIQFLTQLIAKPNAKMLAADPCFVMYRHNAALMGVQYIGVPLKPDFTLDFDAFSAAIKEHNPAIIFLAYPNNPTGVRFKREELESILEMAQGIVVIDEAYGAFSDDSMINLAGSRENLVVLRTLSKIGFAGLRLGYAVGHPTVMNELAKILPPYNMNQLSIVAAQFALRHIDTVHQHIELLKNERERMHQALQKLPETEVFSSDANFITIRLNDATSAFQKLYDAKILVKKLHGSHPLLENCLRLTIGTPEQNDAVLSVLTQHCHNSKPLAKIKQSHKHKLIFTAIAIVILAAIACTWAFFQFQ